MTRRERAATEPQERRSQRRVSARSVPSLRAHLNGGARVTLMDLSLGGVRLETTRHMRPGQSVSVRFSVNDKVMTVGAMVVRAAVVRLHPGEVRYETGLRLCEELACEALQLSLIDTEPEDLIDLPSDTAAAGETGDALVFTHVAEGAALEAARRGWWLAGRRRRRLVVVNGP